MSVLGRNGLRKTGRVKQQGWGKVKRRRWERPDPLSGEDPIKIEGSRVCKEVELRVWDYKGQW